MYNVFALQLFLKSMPSGYNISLSLSIANIADISRSCYKRLNTSQLVDITLTRELCVSCCLVLDIISFDVSVFIVTSLLEKTKMAGFTMASDPAK